MGNDKRVKKLFGANGLGIPDRMYDFISGYAAQCLPERLRRAETRIGVIGVLAHDRQDGCAGRLQIFQVCDDGLEGTKRAGHCKSNCFSF